MKNNKGADKIFDATLKVISKYTIAGTRMHLIAEEADIRQSNIHYYFKSKNDLLVRLQQRVSEHCFAFRDEIRDDYDPASIDDQLELFVVQKLDFILKEKEYDFVEMDFWIQSRANAKIRKSMAEKYQDWRREFTEHVLEPFAPDLPDEEKKRIAYVAISLLQGATVQYHLEKFDVRDYFDYCKSVLKTLMHLE